MSPPLFEFAEASEEDYDSLDYQSGNETDLNAEILESLDGGIANAGAPTVAPWNR